MNETHNLISMPPTTTHYLNTAAAAAFLAVSPIFLAKLRVLGGGPVYARFGRAVRYELADLQNWARCQQRRSTSEYPTACAS